MTTNSDPVVQGIEVTYLDAPARDIRMSSRGVAVDQNYFWNYDLDTCPNGKVQLLTREDLPAYGKLGDYVDGFIVAWAPIPKKPENRS